MKCYEIYYQAFAPTSPRIPHRSHFLEEPMRAALPAVSDPTLDRLHIRPWPDPVIDAVGHDPRSSYVERFWLAVLGPSTTWLMRRMASGLEAEPAGFDLPLSDTARALGLGGEGRSSPFIRALNRCCQFELAQPEDDAVLAVRRRLPPLNRRQLARLPEALQAEHERWQVSELHISPVEAMRRRSRRLALSLLELGEDLEATERQLLRWRYHPSLCRESALWAWERHVAALAAAGEDGEP
ncbi:MAG: hypothetical protein M3R01_05245 [Actinomycetota bacterium]|nr:hypothetical protein [Actinomycetota bacterium]